MPKKRVSFVSSPESVKGWFDCFSKLFGKYGIPLPSRGGLTGPPDPSWMYLALCLAASYVPGLKISAGNYEKKWSPGARAKLCADVTLLRTKNEHLSVQAACRILANRLPWKSFLSLHGSDSPDAEAADAIVHRKRGESLRRMYSTLKQTRDPAFILVEQVQSRWPGQLEPYLQDISDRYRLA